MKWWQRSFSIFADDLRLRNIEADCIYAGIMIDTNNFITRAGVRTFEAAAFLRRSGADMTRVRKLLRDNIDSYKARAEAVRTASIYKDCICHCQVSQRGPGKSYSSGRSGGKRAFEYCRCKSIFCADAV